MHTGIKVIPVLVYVYTILRHIYSSLTPSVKAFVSGEMIETFCMTASQQ